MSYAVEHRTMHIPSTAYAIAVARLHRDGHTKKPTVARWIVEREVVLALSDMGFDPRDYDQDAISQKILREINGEEGE